MTFFKHLTAVQYPKCHSFCLKIGYFPKVTQKTEKSRYFKIGELIKD